MEKLDLIAKALIEFQSKKPVIELNSTVKVKTKQGGEYSFKYATLAHALEKVQPVLTACKLAYTQFTDSENNLHTMLLHESGQFIEGVKPLDLPNGASAQEVGSFITYYKRYSLLAMLGVVAEDDEDGNIASGNTASKREIKSWASDKDVDGILKLISDGDFVRAENGLKYWQTDDRGISIANKQKIEVNLNAAKNG